MAAKTLRSLAVSAFCEDMAMMLAAGIQVDDALSLMRGDSGDGPLYDAASAVLERVQMGEPLAEAVEQCGYFPAYAAQLVAAGEAAGSRSTAGLANASAVSAVHSPLAGFASNSRRNSASNRSAI